MITNITVAAWLTEADAVPDSIQIADMDPWLVARAQLPQGMHVTLRAAKFGDPNVLVCLGPKPIDAEDDVVVRIECPGRLVPSILGAMARNLELDDA